jgi:hypothetical protein
VKLFFLNPTAYLPRKSRDMHVSTILALIYMRVRGREERIAKAQLVFEQSGSSH